MTVRDRPEPSELPVLTESLPVEEIPPAALATIIDIELPFQVRAGDDPNGDADWEATRPSPRPAAAPVIATPYAPLIDRLLDAGPEPYGMQVEITPDHRVIGTWQIGIGPDDTSDVHAPKAQASLRACVAADGNSRETAAFLVLRHWWVNGADRYELDQLYQELTRAVLDRFDALMEGLADHAKPMPPYVVYLVDGRRKKPRVFIAARLARELLHALGDGRAVAGLELHVAHGRGTGASPVAATLPSDLASADSVPAELPEHDPGRPAAPASKPAPPPPPVRRRADETFVAERLSEENLRWMRKASNRP